MDETRAECLRCDKPLTHCVCGDIVPLAPRTQVLVLQHPKERAHPLGTARFLGLGLAGSKVVVAHGLDADRHLPDPSVRAALLFPGEGAVSTDALSPAERPEVLVVVDGTWPTARSLVRANPRLASLPRVTVPGEHESRYRIRREPKAGYLSTLEATLYALAGLEPELEGTGALLTAFDRMIDRQIAARDQSQAERRRRGSTRGYVGVPRALGEDYDALVLVYADFSHRRPDKTRGMLRLCAVRCHDGALFDVLVGEGVAPADVPPGAPELHAALAAPRTARQAVAALRTFLPDDAIVGGWNGTLAARLGAELGRPAFDLAAAYRSRHGAGDGVVERILARRGIEAPPLPLGGRAGPRLGNALGLARALRDEATARASTRARQVRQDGATCPTIR